MDEGSAGDSGPDPGPPTQAIPAQPAATGWVLAGRYRVLDRIGSGGMAEVFRARDELLNRHVAVKVFRAPVDEPGNSSSTERRELELQALAQLSHPNLITLFDGSLADGQTAFLVMELVVGPNLAARLREGPLPEPQARELGAQIADGLAYVHARGMVHRDVKPANILLGADGSPTDPDAVRSRLSDFGIVRMVDNARLTAVDFTLGTASYLAPEQARGANVDAAADVYSLGLVLIEALTGVRSFDGPLHEAVAARLVRSPDIPPTLPEPWPGLLAAMTAADPAARPSALDVASSLRNGAQPPLALPVAGVAGAGLASANTGPVDAADLTQLVRTVPPDAVLDAEAPVKDRRTGLLVAALAIIAVIAAAGFLLLRPASHQADPGGGLTTTPTQGHTRSGPRDSGSRSAPVAAVPVTATDAGTSSHRSTSSAPARSSSRSSASSSSPSARPSSPAIVSTSAASSSASSSATHPSTTAASTSAASSTSSAP